MENKARILSFYDCFLIAGVTVTSIVYSMVTRTFDLTGLMAGITGVVCVVLVAKGSIWNYLFGIVNVSLYAWISYKASLYGDAALNALYYFPMQFIGIWQWRKRGAESSNQVRARRLNAWQRIGVFVSAVFLIAAFGFLLRTFGDPQPFKDSATTVLSIIAQILMALAFMEQWLFWIITNIISIIMWAVCIAGGEPHAELMLIMWVFYLLNSLNGCRVWLRLSR